MITFNEVEITSWISRYLFSFFRIASFMMIIPIFGSEMIPARIKLLIAISVTLPIVMSLSDISLNMGVNFGTLLVVCSQILIGISLGFFFQILFEIMRALGQFVAFQAGLGFAMMNDPQSKNQVSEVSQFYLLFATLLFLSINGHLSMIQLLSQSFDVFPLSNDAFFSIHYDALVGLVGLTFKAALQMCLPLMISILIANLALGVLTKAAPQLNIFTIGFPILMLVGLCLIWFGFSELKEPFLEQFHFLENNALHRLKEG